MDNNYDFFISYNHEDEQWATWIAKTLEDSGYTTIIQAWDFKPGNNFILEMQKAVTNSHKTLLVLSKNYNDSAFCQPEWAAAIKLDPMGNDRRVIPVRIENITPSGLLSQIVYIDLCNLSEEDAKDSLIKGVRDDNLRKEKKVVFPRNDMRYAAVAEKKQPYKFIFTFNKDCIVEPISARTKNNLREWFINGCVEDFEVIINDERVEVCYGYLKKIMKKIQQEEELTEEEEHMYDLYMKVIKQCEHEVALKKQACDFFLKDEFLHGYFWINSCFKLYPFIEQILNFECFNDEKMSDSSYIALDFYVYPRPKECHSYFTAPLGREKVEKVFGKITNYNVFGDVLDLEKELLKEVAIYYYFFLAREIINFDMKKIVENKQVMNLLNFQIGLH